MRIVTALCLLLLGLIGRPEVQAACGGGGWKSRDKPGRHSQRSERVVHESQEVSYKAAPAVSVERSDFNSSRFDAVRSDLRLSERQYDEISDAKRDIQRKLDELRRNQEKAQEKYDRCKGRCDKERDRLESANRALNQFNANREFDRLLDGILTERQMDVYAAQKLKDLPAPR